MTNSNFEALSKVTVMFAPQDWDKTAKGAIVAYGNGHLSIEDDKAYYLEDGDKWDSEPIRFEVDYHEGAIDTNVLYLSLRAKGIRYERLVESCNGDINQVSAIQLRRMACTAPKVEHSARSQFNTTLKEMEDVAGKPQFKMQPRNTDYDDGDFVELFAGHVSRDRLAMVGEQVKRAVSKAAEEHSVEHTPPKNRNVLTVGSLDCLVPNKPIDYVPVQGNDKSNSTDFDPDVLGQITSELDANAPEGLADLPEAKHYCRECSCKSCGAPISFYGVSEKEYAVATNKGKSPINFTEDELEDFFGDTDKIDGVIYDHSRLCFECKGYEC